jgi:hypothetical protein
MAYIDQNRKAGLAKEIAKVMPTNWKYTLRVNHHSTLVLTIRQADVDLIKENMVSQERDKGTLSYVSVNEHNLQGYYSGKLLKIFEAIKGAMNVGNHDRSDIQSDYFDVGWYITINIGEYDSPFRFVPTSDKNVTRPAGMPEGLDEAGEMAWMKNRIAQLEGRAQSCSLPMQKNSREN